MYGLNGFVELNR